MYFLKLLMDLKFSLLPDFFSLRETDLGSGARRVRRSTIWQVHLGKERGGAETQSEEDVGELRGQKSLQRCCFCCMGHSVDNGLTSLAGKVTFLGGQPCYRENKEKT